MILAPSVAAGYSLGYHSRRSFFSTFEATNPAMLIGSLADPNGGA